MKKSPTGQSVVPIALSAMPTGMLSEHSASPVSELPETPTDTGPSKPKCRIKIPRPPEVIPLGQRFVLIKIGDMYLRHKRSTKLICVRVKPPIVPPLSREPSSNPAEYPRRVTKNFRFDNFNFVADDSSVVQADRKVRHLRQHSLVSTFLVLVDGGLHMLCAQEDSRGVAHVVLDPVPDGSSWRLHPVGPDQFVMESVQYGGRCLALARFGLCLERLTCRDWERLRHGVCPPHRKVTITNIPDFAFTSPGVFIT